MKDLLYLKDEQIKEFIQLLYYAHRETFSDPKEVLSKKFFGPAHLRALNLIEGNPGINLGELIFKLKITKQSLNRVLRDLIKSKIIKQVQDENDTRKKNLFLDKEGKVFFETVYNTQKKRIFNALKNSSSDSVINFKDVLKKIINGK
jgi:DNA-binding MarR family transcriptional regulator|tara:strand:+ start:664 stop:1104 length:441 start_codon:yes stop_codon:yes gene_type:complete